MCGFFEETRRLGFMLYTIPRIILKLYQNYSEMLLSQFIEVSFALVWKMIHLTRARLCVLTLRCIDYQRQVVFRHVLWKKDMFLLNSVYW